MFAIDIRRMFYVFGVLAETFYKNYNGRKRVFEPNQSGNSVKYRFLGENGGKWGYITKRILVGYIRGFVFHIDSVSGHKNRVLVPFGPHNEQGLLHVYRIVVWIL